MTFREVVPNGRCPRVYLSTDTSPSPSVYEPLIAIAADSAGESLRLDYNYATGTDEDVVYIPAAPGQHNVVDEPVVVGERVQSVGNEALAKTSVSYACEAPKNFRTSRNYCRHNRYDCGRRREDACAAVKGDEDAGT